MFRIRRTGRWLVMLIASVFLIVATAGGGGSLNLAGSTGPVAVTAAEGHASPAARKAIAYAKRQLGKPYLWAGTGPAAFDCSGLTMKAWQAAGVDIPRTSESQWDGLVHVTDPKPGDLVFFAGSDGTFTSPGHVGIVLSGNAHGGHMIEAYATGYNIHVGRYGPGGWGGDTVIVGFARPDGAA